jgi:hypothetical protein
MSNKANRTPHWEKQGNTSWVSCRSCQAWFPVGPDILAAATINLLCPHCQDEFLPDEAARIIEP